MGKEELELDIKEKTDVKELLEILRKSEPALGNLTETVIVSVNREYATYDTILKDKDEVAFLPPVSGG